jgi:hypothetical protein
MKWWLAPVVLLAACSHTEVRVDSAAAATRTQSGLQVQIESGRGLAALLGLTALTAAMFDYERGRMRYRENRSMPVGEARPDAAAPLAPDRTISEQDCTRPIEDFSANLKCR